MSGKGSAPRPFSVGHEEFSNSWERIFKNAALERRSGSAIPQRETSDCVGEVPQQSEVSETIQD